MTREEAINNVRQMSLPKETMEILQALAPELAESEDERIIKFLKDAATLDAADELFQEYGVKHTQVIAWLEKQKENIEKEYVFRPLAGTDITIAVEQAIRRAKEGEHLVLAFNGVYLPVKEYNNTKERVDKYEAYLEKQKEASKAIEAIERIDKYIDEHLANAHDMKDSNPDKKYYRGWDDALGEMARILQDVYSEEKQKEPIDYRKLYEDIAKSDWFKKAYEGKSLVCDDEQKEQKPAEKHDIVAKLKEHLANTPKEQLEAKWKELEKWNHVGPTVEEYLNSIKPKEHCDLEKAAEEYRRLSLNTAIIPNIDGPTSEYCGTIKGAFIAGARWMESQFEHCGSFPIEDQRGGYWPIDYFIKRNR